MGGRAFANHDPPLATPRMPLEIYSQVLDSILTLLRQHFVYVDSPIEAPGKDSYGDVDFLVCSPTSSSFDILSTHRKTVGENLSKLLNAKAFFAESGNPTINLAIPWPQSKIGQEERYIQIDVHSLPSPKLYTWELFHSAHGDLWNILGSTIRPFGFTVNDRGLFLRIPEIELHDRKKSMVFLTDSPSEVLALLDLDEERWWKQFENQDEMFEYAAGCRLFWVKEKVESAEEGDEANIVGEVGGGLGAQEGGEAGKKKLKHNDRQRMAKRPIFASWIEEFIPRCREQGRFGSNTITREGIRDEVFKKYPIKEEYETRLRDWSMLRHKDELWREVIKGSVPVEGVDPPLRAAAIRQLKSVIMEQEEWEGKVVDAARTNEEGYWNLDVVREFVKGNWQKAGEIGWIRTQQRAKETMRVKAEKKATLAAE
jgi:hypothetical protein